MSIFSAGRQVVVLRDEIRSAGLGPSVWGELASVANGPVYLFLAFEPLLGPGGREILLVALAAVAFSKGWPAAVEVGQKVRAVIGTAAELRVLADEPDLSAGVMVLMTRNPNRTTYVLDRLDASPHPDVKDAVAKARAELAASTASAPPNGVIFDY